MADDKEKEKEKEPFFKLYNLDAVEKIKKDEKIELPQRKLSIPKDERWNEKQMASKTMQGILNGDSIKTISKSMEEVVKNNEVSAMRIARTMHTSAENAGRLQSFKDLAEQGVVQKKVWQATPDDRVRASHLDIDGEEQDIDKPFSNGCMFPGDGKGPSEEVWNCRCAMSDHIIGFRRKDGSISEVKYKGEETLHDKQIRAQKAKGLKSQIVKKKRDANKGKDVKLLGRDDFGKAGTYLAYRVGGIYDSPFGYLSFAIEERQTDQYVASHPELGLNTYNIKVKNPLVGNSSFKKSEYSPRASESALADIYQQLFGKLPSQEDFLENIHKYNKEIVEEAKKRGYDALLLDVSPVNKLSGTRTYKQEIALFNEYKKNAKRR